MSGLHQGEPANGAVFLGLPVSRCAFPFFDKIEMHNQLFRGLILLCGKRERQRLQKYPLGRCNAQLFPQLSDQRLPVLLTLFHVPTEHGDEAARLVDDCLREAALRWAPDGAVRFVADISTISRWSDAKG